MFCVSLQPRGIRHKANQVASSWAIVWLSLSTVTVASAQCHESATAACLQEARFRVEMEWRDFEGQSGPGRVVPLGFPASDSAIFWFFGEDNWEVLVKVLDGCPLNQRFWVFAAASTSVEYTLRVTDEITGQERTYFNPLGTASPAVTDTGAFATCDPDVPGPMPDDGLPTFDSVGLYGPSSPLNQPIGPEPEIDPHSTALVGSLFDAGPLVIQVRQYSSPVFFSDGATPRFDVPLLCGPVWELGVDSMLSVPIPDTAEPAQDVDGAANPPVGCGEDSDQDNHMVVLDLTSRCEYDFWQMRRSGSGWQASWGAALPLDGSGIYPTGLSTRGSGFAFLGGLIWPDELASEEIGHALVFSYPFARAGGPVAPATESDGPSGRADAIPEGARVQLDPALDLHGLGLAQHERTIARALQVYGMYLVDTGGDSGIGLYAIDPKSAEGDVYDGLLPDEDFVELPGIPTSAFRVLRLPPQDGNWQDRVDLPSNHCVTYR